MAAKLPEVQITLLVLQIHGVPKIMQGFITMYETSKSPAILGRRYLPSKTQDGSQLTGSNNISETDAYHQNSGYTLAGKRTDTWHDLIKIVYFDINRRPTSLI